MIKYWVGKYEEAQHGWVVCGLARVETHCERKLNGKLEHTNVEAVGERMDLGDYEEEQYMAYLQDHKLCRELKSEELMKTQIKRMR